jgi:chromosome segregation ATPase
LIDRKVDFKMIEEHESNIEELRNSVIIRKEKLLESENQIIFKEKSKDEEIKNLENLIDEKVSTIDQYKQEINMLKQDINALNSEKSEILEQIESLNKAKDDSNAEINELNSQIEKLTNSLESKNQNIKELEQKVESKEQDIEKIKVEFEKEIEKLKIQHQQEIDKINQKFEEEKQKIVEEKSSQQQTLENFMQINEKIQIITDHKKIIAQINQILEDAKVRLLLIIPRFDQLTELDLSKVNENVAINLSTSIDMSNKENKRLINQLYNNYNINIRDYEEEDLWALKKDGDSLFIAPKLENGDFFGIYTKDRNTVNLFSGIISDAHLRAKKISL